MYINSHYLFSGAELMEGVAALPMSARILKLLPSVERKLVQKVQKRSSQRPATNWKLPEHSLLSCEFYITMD